MYQVDYVIKCASGLHARPASELVEFANKFESDITIINKDDDDIEADAKSIIGILTLGADKGTNVTISAEGADEKEAVDQIVALLDTIED